MIARLPVLSTFLLGSCHAFTSTPNPTLYASFLPYSQRTPMTLASSDSNSPIDVFVEGVSKRFEIAQESRAGGASFTQIIADVLAGEYDADSTKADIEETVASAPCVMFTWESSPSCKQALSAMEAAEAKVKIVRLDDPWDEGNPIRAELGKMVGKSSVPCIFIAGKYVGGFDSGPSEEAPGIQKLAFKGTLRPMLEEAGAL
eukprot:CAMPEP_0198254328 /NCGR_PEP_ID=MMETSP1447-20131203/4642_1 /TAXON_ID=420782 /ORGANISM="Chaetoceros dichaeta, Strain CCMP1751" /LENGTH=201 /DNA_ID=CAMNT_0043940331 /DNA_START=21 /DNA_END=626 /DNA_ORIENTATION=-